jgi:hypothetical protein
MTTLLPRHYLDGRWHAITGSGRCVADFEDEDQARWWTETAAYDYEGGLALVSPDGELDTGHDVFPAGAWERDWGFA